MKMECYIIVDLYKLFMLISSIKLLAHEFLIN